MQPQNGNIIRALVTRNKELKGEAELYLKLSQLIMETLKARTLECRALRAKLNEVKAKTTL